MVGNKSGFYVNEIAISQLCHWLWWGPLANKIPPRVHGECKKSVLNVHRQLMEGCRESTEG